MTSYRLLLGHRLLAVQRSDLHLEHGCSSAIHWPKAFWLELCMNRQEAHQDLAAEQVRDEALLAKCPARDNSEWLATVAAREEEYPNNNEGHAHPLPAPREDLVMPPIPLVLP